MSGIFSRRLFTAIRYALLEQGRNRLALGLLLVFVPLWYYLFLLVTQGTTLVIKYWNTGQLLSVDGGNLTLLTAGLNAITLIIGFMFFASTERGMPFDRRLVLSGYPQVVLVLGKLIALLIVTALVALYTTLILFAFWRHGHPTELLFIWLGFWCAALIYGGFGLLLGALVTSELVGFFLVIMVSLIDTSLQNPLGNPLGNQPLLREFPSFGAMQLAVAGGFTRLFPGVDVGLSLAWFAGFAVLGLLIFWWRTRARRVQVVRSRAENGAALSPDPAPLAGHAQQN
jgi:ABC-2 type transport system permease protein